MKGLGKVIGIVRGMLDIQLVNVIIIILKETISQRQLDVSTNRRIPIEEHFPPSQENLQRRDKYTK